MLIFNGSCEFFDGNWQLLMENVNCLMENINVWWKILISDGKFQFCLRKMLIFVDKLKRNCQKGPKPCSNDARRNLLSNDVDESFWDALWLELWPFEVLITVFLHFSFFRRVFVIATIFNRCTVQFAIIITNRQLLRRLVAWVMAIFVFSWKGLWKIRRQHTCMPSQS